MRTDRGRVFLAPFDVVFSNFDIVEPDLLYISRERLDGVLTKAHVRGAPDLVVEIGSPSTRRRDETIKRRLYERFGVSEYWVIDPELERSKCFDELATAMNGCGIGREEQRRVDVAAPAGPRIAVDKIFEDGHRRDGLVRTAAVATVAIISR